LKLPTLFRKNISTARVTGEVAQTGGGLRRIMESYSGAWQQNIEIDVASGLTYAPLYSCVTLIASDISKMAIRLVEKKEQVWVPSRDSAAYSPVLRKPNRYQNFKKFIEHWIVLKLIHGNSYILKERDQRNVVVGLYPLDPLRVKTYVSPDGTVFYGLQRDNLSGLTQEVVYVPSSEIIHDVMVPLYHPLVGVSPITACGLAALQGLAIQKSSTQFFRNGSRPGGILTAPGLISDETAARLKEEWEKNYGGDNQGRVAVLGDGLEYASMSVNPVDAQLIEQLKWTAIDICSAFHVPPYKIGQGVMPNYQNAAVLNQIYYSDCLQTLIEDVERLLDEGLGLDGVTRGVEFDLSDLIRMDFKTHVDALTSAVKGQLMKTNEARTRLGLEPTDGGDEIYVQQQYYPLSALKNQTLPPPPAPLPEEEEPEEEDDEVEEEEQNEEDDDSNETEERDAMSQVLKAFRFELYRQ
jgi:HK97 family phage portal protein